MHSKSILDILHELGIKLDSDVRKILYILMKKEIVNENDIADALSMKINDVRKPLYKLSELGFVNYTKAKDLEKKWWYIYNWQLDKAKIHYRYVMHLRAILHQKERELMSERDYAFQCRKCKRKYTYQEALENDFICESEGCSGVVRAVSNAKLISQLSKEIEELLSQINFEEEDIRRNREKQINAREELLRKEAEALAKEEAKAERAAARKKAPAKKKLVRKKPAPKKAKPKKKAVKKKPAGKKKPVRRPVKKKPVRKPAKKRR